MKSTKKEKNFMRILRYAWEFYCAKFSSIVLGFSVPLILAYAVLLLAQVPSYPALGGVFLRTVSIPDLSTTDYLVIGAALILANIIVADAITNINLLIKRGRTLSEISSEVWKGMTGYATKVFSIFIILFLVMVLFQILTFEIKGQPLIFPILMITVTLAIFFTPPAIVIDEDDAIAAIAHSIRLLLHSPGFYLSSILLWALLGLVANTIVGLIAFPIFTPQYAPYVLVLFNCVFVYPLLLVLQTHMYMEKYPLAK